MGNTVTGQNSCTMHYIRAVVLENLVLENLKQTVTFALENEQEFVRRLMNRSAKEQQKQIQSMKRNWLQRSVGLVSWITSSNGFMRTI